MTDNEIMKALSICSNENGICSECPYSDDYTNCNTRIAKDTLDFITRKHAENERLKEEKSKLENKMDEMYPLVMQLPNAMQQAKSKAYKEFADRLKRNTRKMSSSDFGGEFWDKAVLVSDIDNLLKEMAGEG